MTSKFSGTQNKAWCESCCFHCWLGGGVIKDAWQSDTQVDFYQLFNPSLAQFLLTVLHYIDFTLKNAAGQFYLKCFLQLGPKNVTFLSLGTIRAVQVWGGRLTSVQEWELYFFFFCPPFTSWGGQGAHSGSTWAKGLHSDVAAMPYNCIHL